MGILEKLSGKAKEKVEEFKEGREREADIRKMEKEQYAKTYEVEARKQALIHAKTKATEKAKSRTIPASEKLLSAGKSFLDKSSDIFSKAQSKPYGRTPPRQPSMRMPSSGRKMPTARPSRDTAMPTGLYPQGDRRFVEIGDKPVPQSALSGGLEAAFFGPSTRQGGGGLLDAFYGPPSSATKTAVDKAMPKSMRVRKKK